MILVKASTLTWKSILDKVHITIRLQEKEIKHKIYKKRHIILKQWMIVQIE